MNYFIKFSCFVFILHIGAANLVKNNDYEYKVFPELKYINETVNPCDNFYEFACGNFKNFHPRPEKELLWDNFKIVQKEINDMATTILKSSIRMFDPSAVKKAKDMYFGCMNPDLAAEQSIKPLSDAFDKLGGWPLVSTISKPNVKISWDFIAEVIAEFGLPLFFHWDIQPYYFDPNFNMIVLQKDPLSLPNNAVSDIDDFQFNILYYIAQDFKADKNSRPPYMQYLIDVAKKFVRPDHMSLYEKQIIKGIEKVYDILMKINKLKEEDSNMGDDEYGDIDSIEDLQDWTDTFSKNFTKKIDWVLFFSKAFSKTDAQITKETKISLQVQYVVKSLLTIIEETPDEVIMNFIFTRLATFVAQDANREMWTMFNNFYKQMNYTVYSREEYCLRKVTSHPGVGLSLAIAHEYQNYHFSLLKISKPEEIIENMLEAFFELLDEKDWVDEAAKEWVRKKADSMVRLVAFPDYVYDRRKLDEYYTKLQICAHDHFGNSQRIRAFNFAKNIETIDKPRRRDIWNQSPLIANAFYNAWNNRIVFPSAIMNPPFFTGVSKLVDYSRIGALIGHEITHGFDTKGRNTDGNGMFVPQAWNANVTAVFNNKSKCFINQYSKYNIEEINQKVNGGYTQTENIADNGGIREAFRAFQKTNNNSSYPPEYFTTKYTTEQLFFISYASMWCKVDTLESLEKMNLMDTHAPNRFRVIGTLSNMEEFGNAFNCPAGSIMNPKNKCILW